MYVCMDLQFILFVVTNKSWRTHTKHHPFAINARGRHKCPWACNSHVFTQGSPYVIHVKGLEQGNEMVSVTLFYFIGDTYKIKK